MSKYRTALLPLFLSPLLLLPQLVTAQAADSNQEQARPQPATTSTVFSARPASANNDTGARAVQTNTRARAANPNADAPVERNKGYTEYSAATASNTALVSEICTYSQYTYTYTCK